MTVTPQAPEDMQCMLVDATPTAPPPERPLSGWVLAASVLLAVRLGRSTSESARFDMAQMQVIHPKRNQSPSHLQHSALKLSSSHACAPWVAEEEGRSWMELWFEDMGRCVKRKEQLQCLCKVRQIQVINMFLVSGADGSGVQREVEQSWEARSESLRRSRAADPEAAAAAEARMALARERAVAAQREREERDAALLVRMQPPQSLA